MVLICLAAAVPATLLYKAVTGDNPFPDDAVTNSLVNAKDFSSIQITMKDNPVVYKKLTIISEFVAMAGLFFEVITNTLKLPQTTVGEPHHEVPDTLKQVSVGVKLLTIMPSFIRARSSDDAWYWKMDAIVTDLAFLKTCLDATQIGEQDAYGKVWRGQSSR